MSVKIYNSGVRRMLTAPQTITAVEEVVETLIPVAQSISPVLTGRYRASHYAMRSTRSVFLFNPVHYATWVEGKYGVLARTLVLASQMRRVSGWGG